MPTTNLKYKQPLNSKSKYYRGMYMPNSVSKIEKNLARGHFEHQKKIEAIKSHQLQPVVEQGKFILHLQKELNQSLEVDLLEGNATTIHEKLKHKMEEALRNKKGSENEVEHKGLTGEQLAEAEKLVEQLLQELSVIIEQMQDHVLLIKHPEEIDNFDGDMYLCITPDFMTKFESSLRQKGFEHLEKIAGDQNKQQISITMPNGVEFKMVFVVKQEPAEIAYSTDEAANNNDSFSAAA